MTNETDDQPEARATAAEESQTGENVPQDTEWEIITQVPYKPSKTGGLTTTIISAVADAEGVEPRDIKDPPLYEAIDMAALETALFGSDTGAQTGNSSTEFMYRGYRIIVKTDGWVLVHEPAEE